MRLHDLFDLERGLGNLVKLAMYPLIVLAAFAVVLDLLGRLGPAGLLFVFLFFVLASPLAYLVRKARGHRPQRAVSRRGAERTPLLPPDEEGE
jgi:hypothetical protein